MKAGFSTGTLLSQRTAAFGTILAVHGAIVYAMANDLAYARSEIIMPPAQLHIFPENPRPFMRRESIPAPEMRRLRVEIPPPDIEIDMPADSAITDVGVGAFMMKKEPPPPPSRSAPRPEARYIIHARVGQNFPNPDAFYPPVSVRREEQGVVSVQVCVGVDGKVIEDPFVAKTSGFSRLDEAALKLARSGRYMAGSVDGVPIVDCLQLPIRFQVKN